MRVVFFGTPELAVPSLREVAARHDVTAVVCQPDKPKGRGKKLAAPPVKAWALEHGIEVHQPTKLNDGTFEAWLREQAPDVCCLAAYGRILKQAILDVPPHGFLNVHPSLLPAYRGVAPIQFAVLNGDDVTGVSIMQLDAGMDSGPVVLQEEMAIGPEDTSLSMSERLAEAGADLLVEAMRLLDAGEMPLTEQDDSAATFTRMLTKSDGRIQWDASADEISNLVRGSIPWPVAQCLYNGEVCRIRKCAVVDAPAGGEPGTVVEASKDRVEVATGKGRLAILEFQAPGKRSMAMEDYLRGHSIAVGDRFESIPRD